MSENDQPETLSVDAALALLDVEDGYVHTFIEAPTGPGQYDGILIGADWSLEEVVALFNKSPPERAGPAARAMLHGVAVRRYAGRGPVFFKTKGTP